MAQGSAYRPLTSLSFFSRGGLSSPPLSFIVAADQYEEGITASDRSEDLSLHLGLVTMAWCEKRLQFFPQVTYNCGNMRI